MIIVRPRQFETEIFVHFLQIDSNLTINIPTVSSEHVDPIAVFEKQPKIILQQLFPWSMGQLWYAH